MLPLVIVFRKKLGYSMKKKREKNKRKRTNVPLRNKERFSSPSFFSNSSCFLKEVYEKFPKGAKYSPLSSLYPL
jgi:hypothetical protein